MSNKVLIISNANELVRVRPERIVYVESDGNYSTMVLHDKTEYVFMMNLHYSIASLFPQGDRRWEAKQVAIYINPIKEMEK